MEDFAEKQTGILRDFDVLAEFEERAAAKRREDHDYKKDTGCLCYDFHFSGSNARAFEIVAIFRIICLNRLRKCIRSRKPLQCQRKDHQRTDTAGLNVAARRTVVV